jgi:hypothetical protein
MTPVTRKPVSRKQRAVVEYAALHPFMHPGDYDKAAGALGLKKGVVVSYAHIFGLNAQMPGHRPDGYVEETDPAPIVVVPVSLITEPAQSDGLTAKIKKYLASNRATKDALADIFDVAPKVIRAALDSLTEQACILDCDDGNYTMPKAIRPATEPVRETLEGLGARQGRFLIGCTADWHVGSKYCREDVITQLYEWYAREGVTKVYLAGNWCDGESRLNMFDLSVHGMTPQIHEFLRICPQFPGIETYVLSGDDHEGWWVQREGINIGQLLALEAQKAGRSDIKDLGYMERDIELASSQIMRIIHGGGGSAYATSYAAQKYVESLQGGEKPRIVVMGHYHKYEAGYPREVFVLQPGCCEDQTPWMRKNKLQAHVGGCIMDVRINADGLLNEIGHRWKPFYDKTFYEYK